jgi:uncharacterized protein (TIGR03663 family)
MAKRRSQRLRPAREAIQKSQTVTRDDGQTPLTATPTLLEQPSTITHYPLPITDWLTVERVLWSAVMLVAALVRALNLAYFPLNDAEAQLAQAAYMLAHGQSDAALRGSPFLVGSNALVFWLFGEFDLTARLVPALVGVLMAALTYRLRDELGRWGALIAGGLFAISATFVYYSRMVNGDLVAVTASYAALIFLWEFIRKQEGVALIRAGIAFALALTSGQTTYTILLCVVSFAALVAVLRATKQVAVPEIESLLMVLRHSPLATRHIALAARNGGIAFILVCLTSATAALFNPLGLQGAVDLFTGWLGQWAGANNQAPSYFLQLFFSYELLPLVFGLGGMLYGLARGERFANFAAWWAIVALTWHTLAPVKSASTLLVVLTPLILMAGQVIGRLLTELARNFALANEGLFIALGLLTCGIFGLNLSNYAQTGERNYIIVMTIAVGMLVLIGVMVGGFTAFITSDAPSPTGKSNSDAFSVNPLWQGVARAIQVWGVIALAGLSVLAVRASINLSFAQADDPRELMVESPTTLEARELRPMLEDLSNRREGDPHIIPIAAEVNIGPALRWYLRDFKVRYFNDVPNTATEPLVIVPAQGKQPGFNNYASQKVRWRWQKPSEPLAGQNFWKWFMYRGLHEVLPSYDIIVYAQQR